MPQDKLYSLIPTHIQQLNAYQSARRLGGNADIWLNANELPYCIDKKSNQMLNRYPEAQPSELKQMYTRYLGINKEQLLVTRGADEGIELVIKTFCESKKDEIMFFPPTYGMYKVSADSLAVNCKAIPLLNNWQLPLSEVKNNLNKTKIIFLCNPNNPTGNIFDLTQLTQLLEIVNGKAIVVLDQAYIEFYPEACMIELLNNYPNLIILRTLSKAFGLAGLRCGFIIANQLLIEVINKVIAPYPIASIVSTQVEKFLTAKAIKSMQQRVIRLNQAKQQLSRELSKLSCIKEVYPSYANFILVKTNPKYQVFNMLKLAKIIVRDQSTQYGLKDCLRISIGNAAENKKLLQVLKQI